VPLLTASALPLSTYIDAIKIDGDLLANAAEKTSLDADLPTCPDWTVRDLLKHITYVHRWAAGYVAGALTERVARLSEAEIMQTPSDDSSAVARFRDGYHALTQTLGAASPDLQCWTFLEAPSALIFWARRQAHETAIHRVDVDVGASWSVRFAPEGGDVERDTENGDCTISGPAEALYLLLWNRGDASRVAVTGERSLLDEWPAVMHIRWT
jgi:hypothetical protein